MQTIQPIIKPVSLTCNLGCSYCYYGPLREFEFRYLLGEKVLEMPKMTLRTLEELILAFSVCEPLPEFIWHGGEPLLAGLDFFGKVITLQQEILSQKPFVNSIQTNATLVDDQWAEFFSTYTFQVGVSLDGLPKMNDIYRRYHSGNGTANRVISGIQSLQRYGINPSIICTVTKANVNYPLEVYAFLRSLGIKKMKFSHLHERERLGELALMAVSPEEYADFLIAVMDAWVEENDPTIEITELRSLIQILTGGDEKGCIFSGVCDRYLTIEYNGSVFLCDTIARPGEMVLLGNIHDGLESIVSSLRFQEFQNWLMNLHESKKNEDWYPIISIGCLGDYPDIREDELQNTYAQGWILLAKAVAGRLIQHGFSLKLTLA